MGIGVRQNPGIGGIDELTTGEELFVQNLAGLSYVEGDILFHNASDLINLPIGTNGQVLTVNAGATAPEWTTIAGTGDVVGPASVTDNALVRFDGTTGKLIKESTVVNASEISIALGVGSPTVDQVQEYINNTGSSGFFLGGELSDGGAGTLDVAAGSGFIRTTNDENAELQSFKWSASSGIAVTDNTTQYVYVDDSGVISLSTNEFLEAPDKIMLGVVTDEGGSTVHTFSLGVRLQESVGQMGRYIRRVEGISRDKRKGGLIFGQSGDANRDVTMTTGSLWWGRTEYTISAIDTSGADTFITYSAGGQEDAVASQWPNAQFDSSGTLTTMTNNRWANLFFFIEPDGHIIMIYGREEFVTEAQAENEGVPSSSLPSRVSDTSILAARFTFQKSANTATISSAFEELFANAGVTDHGDLAGLMDDDHAQYALLAGRSGGQTLIGGTDASDDLILASTSNGTKGTIRMGNATTGLFYDEVNGRLSINNSENDVTVGGVTIGATLMIHGIDDTSLELALHQHSNSASMGGSMDLARSRGTEGSETAVQDNDRLSSIFALGHDGTDYEQAALISIEVDGTPGAGDMPGRIIFSTTPDGSAAPAEAMRISQDKAITMAGSLAVTGAASASNLSGTNTGDEAAASVTVAGVVELATVAETNTGTDTTRAVTPDGLSSAVKSIMLSASGGAPLTTAGCSEPTKIEAATNDINYWALDFDTTTEEHAFWNFPMPDNWDAGVVNAIFYWTNAAGLTTETVDWGIAAGSWADNDAIDAALGTEVTTTDTWLAQNDMHISAASGNITVANATAGEWCTFVVARKVATDDMTGDARLIAVKIEYTIDAYSE